MSLRPSRVFAPRLPASTALVASWLAMSTAACTPLVVTQPQPVPSLPTEPGFVGRVELRAPGLRDEVAEYWSAWGRRLAILRVRTRVVFDADRAVIDVYDFPTERLDELALLLSQKHPYFTDAVPTADAAAVEERGAPTPDCACEGEVVFALSEEEMEALDRRVSVVAWLGDATRRDAHHGAPLRFWTEWRHEDDGRGGLVPRPYRVHALVSKAGAEDAVLFALAGGVLPAPAFARVVARGGSR